MLRYRALIFCGGLGAAGLLCGCSCPRVVSCPAPYSSVVSADVRGEVISEYLADGPVASDCRGMSFTALARRVYGPHVMTRCYPMGRAVRLESPNLIARPVYSLEESNFASR